MPMLFSGIPGLTQRDGPMRPAPSGADGFAGCSMLSYDPALWALCTWLTHGRVSATCCRHASPRLRPPVERRARLASDVLHDGDGTLTDECDGTAWEWGRDAAGQRARCWRR